MSIAPGFLGAGGFPSPDIYDLDFIHRSWTTAQLAAVGFGFARTSAAWDDALTSYATGVPVITATRGLYIEEARTNTFLASTAPATQAIAGLTGTCVCWMTGAGSIALTVGATGTASAGSPVVFSPSGSVTFTVTPPVTFASVEQAGFPTLPIVTAGAAITRNSATLAANPPWTLTSGTVLVKARSAQGITAQQLCWTVDGGTSNRIRINRTASHGLQLLMTSGGVDQFSPSTGTNTLPDSTDFACILSWQAGAYLLKSTVGSDLTASVASVPPSMVNERIACGPGGGQWDGSIYRVARWSSVLTGAQASAALASA